MQPLKPLKPLQHGLRYGKYCPDEKGTCVDFYVVPNTAGDENGYIFYFTTPVPHIVSLFNYKDPYRKGDFLNVTRASYATFLDNVVNKNTEWTNVVNALPDIGNVNQQTIPGTWSWLSMDERAKYDRPNMSLYSSYAAHDAARGLGDSGSHGGSSRKSKRIHRKPTKRRRNRRGNRKTKKN